MKTATKLTAEKLMAMNPSTIAKEFNCGFSGDMNPFDHGGFFYRLEDWQRYGYAETIGFSNGDDSTWLESGCVNQRQDTEDIIRKSFGHLSEDELAILAADPDMQILGQFHHWGNEADQMKTYNEKDSGDAGELEAWGLILEVLESWNA